MTNSTKYCLTAIVCTLILAAAYMITNRYYLHGPYNLSRFDRWTGKASMDYNATVGPRNSSVQFNSRQAEDHGFERID